MQRAQGGLIDPPNEPDARGFQAYPVSLRPVAYNGQRLINQGQNLVDRKLHGVSIRRMRTATDHQAATPVRSEGQLREVCGGQSVVGHGDGGLCQ